MAGVVAALCFWGDSRLALTAAVERRGRGRDHGELAAGRPEYDVASSVVAPLLMQLARASVDQMSWESDEEIQMRLKGWVENIMMRRYK